MDDRAKQLLDLQAQWQRSRARLPWAEKLEMALTMREAALAFRRSRDQRDRGWTREELYDRRS